MSTQQRTLLRQLFSLANNIKHQLATAVSNNLDKRFIFTLRQSTSYHQQYLVSFFVYLLFAELMRVKSVPGEYFVRPLRVKPRDKDDTSTQINCLYLIDFVSRCYKTSFIWRRDPWFGFANLTEHISVWHVRSFARSALTKAFVHFYVTFYAKNMPSYSYNVIDSTEIIPLISCN